MAVGLTKTGVGNGLLLKMLNSKTKKIQPFSITGFTTYATNGVAFDLFGALGGSYPEAKGFLVFEDTASHRFVYDKTNNKILFLVTNTGAEVANATNVSSVTIKGFVVRLL